MKERLIQHKNIQLLHHPANSGNIPQIQLLESIRPPPLLCTSLFNNTKYFFKFEQQKRVSGFLTWVQQNTETFSTRMVLYWHYVS
jgi:hypothetical protein